MPRPARRAKAGEIDRVRSARPRGSVTDMPDSGEADTMTNPSPFAGRPKIVCFGPTPTLQRTMSFDALDAGEANRAAAVHDYASGKGVNAARVLTLLGHPCVHVGPVAGGRGRLIRDDLERAGVACDWVEAAGESRMCLTVVDRGRRQATELVEEPAPIPPGLADALLERLQAHLNAAAVVVLSGSLPPSDDGGCDDLHARAIALAREAGCRTVLDSRARPLRLGVAAGPDVAKPNRFELATTLGRDVSSRRAMHEAMRSMVEAGARTVVVTRGRDGSSACDGPRFWEVDAPRAVVTSPVGSGDAYAAGLAVGLRDGLDVPEACVYASACGAANAESPYAGHLDPSRVADFAGQAGVREAT